MNMPPATAPLIPENAPFSPDQRSWLNGFFAGLLSFDAGAPTALAAGATEGGAAPADDEDDVPWHDPSIPLAERMQMAEGRPVARRLMAAMAQQDCGQCGYNCRDYADAIASHAEARLNLCVPGAKETARTLKTLVEEASGGGAPARAADAAAPAPVAPKGKPGTSRENPAEAVFLSRSRLNRDGSEKATYHIELDLTKSGLEYVPGDSFGLFPVNPPALVAAVIAALGADPDLVVGSRTLAHALTNDVALGLAPDPLFELASYLVGGRRREVARLLAKGDDPDGDAKVLDVLGVLEKFSIRPDPEAFLEALEPLQPRLYSISSSLRAHPGRVSLTVDHVRYTIGERQRFGVASTFVGEGLEPGDTVRCYIQKAHDFALPTDGATPIIMVGPGTGVAPFRSFLHERAAAKASGPAWLFFGHQRRDADFFYEEELAAFQASGTLAKLSLAWSRDAGPKVYVQDRMREEAGELWDWLARGAHLYICGDAKRMAADVEKSLVAVAAEHGRMDEAAARAYLKELRAKGRFQTDVY